MRSKSEVVLHEISVSYIADEDRLLLEMLFEESSRPLWVTRRGAFKLIEIFNEQLGKRNIQNKQPEQSNKKTPIAFERDIAATRNPPYPGQVRLDLEQLKLGDVKVGVLNTLQFIHIESDLLCYQIRFIDNQGQVIQINLSRGLLLNLENLLLLQIEKAQW
jgi:hypothetical protein